MNTVLINLYATVNCSVSENCKAVIQVCIIDIHKYNDARGFKGILVADGARWSEQRRFALHTLRNFGIGKMRLEDTICDELWDFIAFFERKNALVAIDPRLPFMRSACNVIGALVLGLRMGGVDAELDQVADAIINGIGTTDFRFFLLLK